MTLLNRRYDEARTPTHLKEVGARNVAEGWDDQTLVRAVQRGDHNALDALVARYHTPLSQFLERMLGDMDTALDVTQETFLRMMGALDRYKPRAKFSTWLYTIAGNLARDELRRRSVRHERQQPLEDEERTDNLAEPRLAVVDEVVEQFVRADVKAALVKLSDEHRVAVILHYYQGLSYKEIADICGCSVGTVGSRLHYAVKHLRRHLHQDGSLDV